VKDNCALFAPTLLICSC